MSKEEDKEKAIKELDKRYVKKPTETELLKDAIEEIKKQLAEEEKRKEEGKKGEKDYFDF